MAHRARGQSSRRPMLREMRLRPRGPAPPGELRGRQVPRRIPDGFAARGLHFRRTTLNRRIFPMESNSIERLHRAGDRQTLKLTHYGRKTGKPYEVVIWYLVGGDKLYLVSANANRNWVRNVKARPAISLR